MLLTRQQIKAKKRHAKRLGQLLKEVRVELQHNIGMLEDSCIERGSWESREISGSHDTYSVIGDILAIANEWERLNHFEIEERLSQVEEKFYPD